MNNQIEKFNAFVRQRDERAIYKDNLSQKGFFMFYSNNKTYRFFELYLNLCKNNDEKTNFIKFMDSIVDRFFKEEIIPKIKEYKLNDMVLDSLEMTYGNVVENFKNYSIYMNEEKKRENLTRFCYRLIQSKNFKNLVELLKLNIKNTNILGDPDSKYPNLANLYVCYNFRNNTEYFLYLIENYHIKKDIKVAGLNNGDEYPLSAFLNLISYEKSFFDKVINKYDLEMFDLNDSRLFNHFVIISRNHKVSIADFCIYLLENFNYKAFSLDVVKEKGDKNDYAILSSFIEKKEITKKIKDNYIKDANKKRL